MDMNNMINFVDQFPCSRCMAVHGYTVSEIRVGLKSKLKFICNREHCLATFIITCSSGSENINCRFQMAMFSIGCNRTQASRFLCNMNMPPPVTSNSWNSTKRTIHTATVDVASKSMMKAGNEIKDTSGNIVTVSCDGTWQKRGFSSKNGFATVLSVPTHGLPEHVLEAIKPVFEVLSAESLLHKCLHGGTQNSNELFHSMIWMRCPKSILAGRTRLEIGVYDVVILVYNEGQARMPIFKTLGLSVEF